MARDNIAFILRIKTFYLLQGQVADVGYLLKMEGDEVVLQKVDQEIRLCEEEAKAELEQEEARRQLERMQAFLQRARRFFR